MDDLEWNGTEPYADSPTNEPPQTPEDTQVPPPPMDPPYTPGFYAWSGSVQPPQEAPPPRKESPFADSPYVINPPKPPKEKPSPTRPARQKRPILPLIALLVAIGSFALTIGLSIGAKNYFTTLEENYTDLCGALAYQINQLEDQLAAMKAPTVPQLGTATADTPVRVPSSGMTPAQVYAQCVPSVVAINCTGSTYGSFGQLAETASSGSGFILSAEGHIVTNYHVVENSKTIEVSLYDGTTYQAEYIGGNEANDIALIKVDATNLPPVTIGSSSDLIVGDQVAAIGNPLGELASTLTVGYVSAKDRIVTSEGTQINMLQTDAAINPGNSGGPLFNMNGEVVGITSAKYSGTTNSGATIEGIGFAIPTDDVMMMLEDLRTFGRITGGYLGVTVSEVSQEASDLYGLPQGVLVRDVMPGSCAEKAGMRSQDIIINLAGNEVKNLNGLSRALNKCKGGQEVIVTVYRSGREVDLTVVLDERPEEEKPQVTEPVIQPNNPWPGDSFFDDWFGQFFG